MKKISTRLEKIKTSATLAITQKATDLKKNGVDIISFSAGEPDFNTPLHIISSAKKALDKGFTKYTTATGIDELKDAISAESMRARNVCCNSEEVIVSVGAKHVLYNFFNAVLNPKDEVIIPKPYWVSYPDQVLLAGGTPVFVSPEQKNNWILTPEELSKAVTERTKILVLNSPSNPTGTVYDFESMKKLVRRAHELNLYVLSDEVYKNLVYDNEHFVSPLSCCENKNKIFIVDGVSKTFSMTGWRIGWGIGDPEIILAMGKIQGQSTSNPVSFAQSAVVTALNEPMDFFPEWKKEYIFRRNLMVSGLNTIEGIKCNIPGGAFYAFADVSHLLKKLSPDCTDIELSSWLLEQARVAVIPGTAFGAPGFIRLSYATSRENIQKGITRIANAVNML